MKIGVKNTTYQLFLAEVYILAPEILVVKCCAMFLFSASVLLDFKKWNNLGQNMNLLQWIILYTRIDQAIHFITYHNYLHVHFMCYHLPGLVIPSRCSDFWVLLSLPILNLAFSALLRMGWTSAYTMEHLYNFCIYWGIRQ